MNRAPRAKQQRAARYARPTYVGAKGGDGTCKTGRKRYGNPERAYSAALLRSRGGGPMRTYLCPQCGGWHLAPGPPRS